MEIRNNFRAAAGEMKTKLNRRLQRICAQTLSNQAFAARKAVRAEMSVVFRNPRPYTLNAVLVTPANRALPIAEQVALVYIRYDGTVSPEKYLLAEALGGLRADKRYERVLQQAGILPAGQQTTPGPGLPLDGYGQPTSGSITQVLSRVRAFGEAGYRANATAATRMKITRSMRSRAAKEARLAGGDKAEIKAARAGAFIPIVGRADNEFFVAKSHITGGIAGIYKLIGKGHVVSVIRFDSKRPTYSVRFPFLAMVAEAAGQSFSESLGKAIGFVDAE